MDFAFGQPGSSWQVDLKLQGAVICNKTVTILASGVLATGV